jgi:catechol 2,3-dioxygenase-like lactoylglutathione lyase family enzyme
LKVYRIDHVSVNVDDLAAAKAFFVDLGLEVAAEWQMEGAWVGKVMGLSDVKTACVALRAPGGQAWIELVKFYAPQDEQFARQPLANTLGIRHIALAVEDIEAAVSSLKGKGAEFLSEIQQYADSYKLCYVRGPEGMILELAEPLKEPR